MSGINDQCAYNYELHLAFDIICIDYPRTLLSLLISKTPSLTFQAFTKSLASERSRDITFYLQPLCSDFRLKP